MLAALKAFIIGLPTLLHLIERGVNAFEDFVATQKANRLREEVEKAIEKAIHTKDTSDLEKIFRGGGL